MILRTLSLLSCGVALWVGVAASGGCAPSQESRAETRCTPGKEYFCRCANRDEGTDVCSADGLTHSACAPCDSPTGGDDMEADEEGGAEPLPTLDAGRDAASKPGESPCGNGAVQAGEECDDGNDDDSDGCDATCHLSGSDPPASRSCPGLEVHVWNDPVVYGGTTRGSTNTATAKPACPGAADAGAASGSVNPDRVFRVVPHRSGTMRVVTKDVTFDSFLYVTSACNPDSRGNLSYATCANAASGIAAEALMFPVTAGAPYSVIVDGAGVSQQGEFRIVFSIE